MIGGLSARLKPCPFKAETPGEMWHRSGAKARNLLELVRHD
jgi:hypothetical protein